MMLVPTSHAQGCAAQSQHETTTGEAALRDTCDSSAARLNRCDSHMAQQDRASRGREGFACVLRQHIRIEGFNAQCMGVHPCKAATRAHAPCYAHARAEVWRTSHARYDVRSVCESHASRGREAPGRGIIVINAKAELARYIYPYSSHERLRLLSCFESSIDFRSRNTNTYILPYYTLPILLGRS
jgi:hypothetical protein